MVFLVRSSRFRHRAVSERFAEVYRGHAGMANYPWRAIIASNGTVQMFSDVLDWNRELAARLDRVAVGTFVEIEYVDADRFNMRARPKPMKEFE